MASISSVDSIHETDKKSIDGGRTSHHDAEKQNDQKIPQDLVYATGIKLWLMMTGVTLVIFVMLLDISIVSTVCHRTYSS